MHVHLRGRKPLPEGYPTEVCTVGDHLKRRRMDLGLQQKVLASILGASPWTLRLWEARRTSPRIRHYPAIIEFLGYRPWSSPASLSDRLLAARRILGLSQRRLATKLGVDPTTIRDWEAGVHRPVKKSARRLHELFSAIEVE